MKNYAKRIGALLLILAIVASFAACGKKNGGKNNDVAVSEDVDFSEFLVAEKVGTVNRDNFQTEEGGLIYNDANGLWGVISYDGIRDTGAKYTKVIPKNKYFQVRSAEPTSADDIKALNSSSLIDGKGNVIVPSGYAAFYVLNDRYILAATVTGRSYDQKKVVMTYSSSSTLTTVANYGFNEKDSWYAGTWTVFDAKTGKPVPTATGDYPASVSVKSDILILKDAEGNVTHINSNGQPMSGVTVFDNGTYKSEGKIGEVFASDGTKMFSYDLTGYIPNYSSDDNYVASKYEDGSTKYAVLNNKGEILSEGYTESVTLYGDLIHSGNKVYNLQGKNIIEGEFTSVSKDKMFGNNWILHKDETFTVIDIEGNVFFTGGGEDVDIWSNEFLAAKETEDGRYFYSYKDKDYTIKGSSFAPWIVKTSNNNNMYDLVDTMTGETLLEGYSGYSSISRNSLAYYVYAKYSGGADVYLVVSGAQISEVTNKKNEIYDALIESFKAEGINATVNKETGEIALDTAVLFGGDSAVLSDSGKAFLNKFIKAYTNVVYADEYNGFINKTMIEGNTAPVSGSTYASGYDLSVERAENVKNYCLSAETGVNVAPIANTFEAVGYSNSQPIYNDDGSVNMEASRRVSFRFLVDIEI